MFWQRLNFAWIVEIGSLLGAVWDRDGSALSKDPLALL